MLKSQFQKNLIEAGCDEVGRGCIAGPVVAAAVIMPPDYKNNNIMDSKKLSPKKREFVEKEIIKNARSWAIASVSNNTIDKINILNASILAMHRALDKLDIKPEFILVDGNPIGAINRIPAAGETRSNMHVGGRPEKIALTKRDKEICSIIGPTLRKKGQLFVGIDIIGDYLTEINVTSPTGLQELDRFDGINAAGLIWDAMEKKL